MLRIAICDDDPQELSALHQALDTYFQAHPDVAVQISQFSQGEALLAQAGEQPPFDIFILDILMPLMDGITLGRQLRQQHQNGEIIYLTTTRDYAVDSYDVDAFYYLMKPLDPAQLATVLDKASAAHRFRARSCITVSTHDGLQRVAFEGLLYVEQLSRALHYHMADGTTVVGRTLREPFLSAVQPLLCDDRFYVCGSSYVLNFKQISGFSKSDAIFTTDLQLTIPRTLVRATRKSWIEYWLKEGTGHEVRASQ